MGGSGSGNWTGRATTGGSRAIDLLQLRQGAGSFSWSLGGERVGSVGYQLDAFALTLRYSRTNDDGQRREYADRLPIITSEAGFGGQRRWLQCTCGRRCRIVYVGGKGTRCRICYRLAYQSQREDAGTRGLRMAAKVVQQLAGRDAAEYYAPEDFPPKPKGMHWRTYLRLERRHDGMINRSESYLAESMLARFG